VPIIPNLPVAFSSSEKPYTLYENICISIGNMVYTPHTSENGVALVMVYVVV